MTLRTNKMKQPVYEIESQSSDSDSDSYSDSDDEDYWAPGLTESSSKGKRKRMNTMQQEKKRKSIYEKLESLKSKLRQASDNPEKSRRSTKSRTEFRDLYENIGAMETVVNKTERELKRLNNEFELPLFLKCMLPSNVYQGFWLHLPKDFCNDYLPNHDTSIVLADECGNEYKTSFLIERRGLSAGWRGFSLSHWLMKGDILIFHLTAPCKLKVHIVRVNDLDVIHAALCLMSMSASESGPEKKVGRKRRKTEYVEPYQYSTASSSENAKGKNSTPIFPDVIEKGTDIANRRQPNDLCYSRTPFLRSHARAGVTCG